MARSGSDGPEKSERVLLGSRTLPARACSDQSPSQEPPKQTERRDVYEVYRGLLVQHPGDLTPG